MDTSRRGLYLLWHCIKYYFLMNLFQEVTEGVNDSKKCLRFRQVLFNPRQTMRILPPARALRFPRVFQTFNQWTPRYTPTISLALQTQLKKHGSIIIQSKKPFKGLSPIITYVVTRLVTRDPAGELDIGDQDRLRHGLIDLGVIEKSVEPPKCSILIFLTG